MKWLLDTNVVSETARRRPDQRVLDWIASQTLDQLAISAVTLAELHDGALSAPVERKKELSAWLDKLVVPKFAERTLSVTNEILIDWIRCGRKLAARGKAREPADLLIAATARTYDLIIVSRNVRDFSDTGVLVFDPWNGQTHHMDQP